MGFARSIILIDSPGMLVYALHGVAAGGRVQLMPEKVRQLQRV